MPVLVMLGRWRHRWFQAPVPDSPGQRGWRQGDPGTLNGEHELPCRGSDRRRRERFKPLSRLRVFKRNTHTYVGQVRDIHHAGMSMHAVQPMSATESLELEISPVAHGDAAQMIPVRARKVWQENDAGDHSIEIGFRLTRLSRSAQQAIDALRTVNTDYRQRRHPNVPST